MAGARRDYEKYGWESFTMLVALLELCASKMSRMEGRGTSMILAAVRCPL